jgi:flagella basal body P-ring formation protein FlgA
MNMNLQTLTMRTVFVAIFATTALPVSAAEIVLRPKVVPHGTVVKLGDVAAIDAASEEEFERLATLPLMPAPTPGSLRFLRMREIQDMLAAHGEDLASLTFRGESTVTIESPRDGGVKLAAHESSDNQVSRFRAAWTGEPTTVVKRESRDARAAEPILTAAQVDELDAAVEQLFVKYLSEVSGKKANWRVSFQLTKRNLAVIAGATSELRCMGGNTPWTGRQKLVVTFETADGIERLPVPVEVAATKSVIVARQEIERGRVITAADLELQEFENAPVATAKRAPFESLESLVGMEAGRAIQAGDVVMSDEVQPRLLVKRGEELMVYARGGGIQVRITARAKQDGARGQLITVESLNGKKPFDAVVVGDHEAVVFAGGDQPAEATVANEPFSKLRQ